MSDNDIENTEPAKWDPNFTARATKLVAPIINRWFRAEVRRGRLLRSFRPAKTPSTGWPASVGSRCRASQSRR
jgi:hypothetical protein